MSEDDLKAVVRAALDPTLLCAEIDRLRAENTSLRSARRDDDAQRNLQEKCNAELHSENARQAETIAKLRSAIEGEFNFIQYANDMRGAKLEGTVLRLREALKESQ